MTTKSKHNYPSGGFVLLIIMSMLFSSFFYWLYSPTQTEISLENQEQAFKHAIKGEYEQALELSISAAVNTVYDSDYQTQLYIMAARTAIQLNKQAVARDNFIKAYRLSPDNINTHAIISEYLELNKDNNKTEHILLINQLMELNEDKNIDFVYELATSILSTASTENEQQNLLKQFNTKIQQHFKQNDTLKNNTE